MAGNCILRALEPLKQMTADFAALDFAALNTTVCEHMDLFSRCCRLGQLHPGFHRDAGPGIGTPLLTPLIKSMHDPPSFAAEKHNLLRGWQSGPFGPSVRQSWILSAPRGVIDLIARDPIRSPFFVVISQSSRIAHSGCSPNGDDTMVRKRAP